MSGNFGPTQMWQPCVDQRPLELLQNFDTMILSCVHSFQTVQQNLAHAEQVKVDATLKNEIEHKQRLEDLQRENTARKVRCA